MTLPRQSAVNFSDWLPVRVNPSNTNYEALLGLITDDVQKRKAGKAITAEFHLQTGQVIRLSDKTTSGETGDTGADNQNYVQLNGPLIYDVKVGNLNKVTIMGVSGAAEIQVAIKVV